MRILAINADRMSYKANRKTKFAEEIEAKEDTLEDCLVLLSSVEKLDEVNPELNLEDCHTGRPGVAGEAESHQGHDLSLLHI